MSGVTMKLIVHCTRCDNESRAYPIAFKLMAKVLPDGRVVLSDNGLAASLARDGWGSEKGGLGQRRLCPNCLPTVPVARRAVLLNGYILVEPTSGPPEDPCCAEEGIRK